MNNILNKKASETLDILTDGVDFENPSTFKKSPTFMAVHVEQVGEVADGRIYSIAHYYQQNGDMMRDPDMVFIKTCLGWMVVSFCQDGGPRGTIYQEAMTFENGEINIRPDVTRGLKSFATIWMNNIRTQQELKSV